MKKKLLVATRNRGKLVEFNAILSDIGYELIGLDDIANVPEDVEETGSTFEENAKIKARVYGNASGLPTIADDSGLEVDALDGRPGVYSARYAPSVEERNNKLLSELENISDEKRTARFISVVCIYDPGTEKNLVAQGKVEGVITHKPKGNNGFGYDPVFYSTELRKTFGEATDEEKNKISHRARALRNLKDKIKQ